MEGSSTDARNWQDMSLEKGQQEGGAQEKYQAERAEVEDARRFLETLESKRWEGKSKTQGKGSLLLPFTKDRGKGTPKKGKWGLMEIKVAAINVRGMRQPHKAEALKVLFRQERIDVCVATETHMHLYDVAKLAFNNYEVCARDCREDQAMGGGGGYSSWLVIWLALKWWGTRQKCRFQVVRAPPSGTQPAANLTVPGSLEYICRRPPDPVRRRQWA